MPHYCCVPLCTSDGRRKNCKDISFHCFPFDSESSKKWFTAIGRDPGPNFKLTKGTRVCSKHFEPEDFLPSTEFRVRKRLKTNAVPSIFDIKPFTCEECGKSFSLKDNFLTHKKIHAGDKPFICKECGKGFSGKRNLNRHLRTHTGDKPFVCKDCGEAFILKSDLKIHMEIHTGNKPFACAECGKGFAKKGSLVTHLRIHGQKDTISEKENGKCASVINVEVVVKNEIEEGLSYSEDEIECLEKDPLSLDSEEGGRWSSMNELSVKRETKKCEADAVSVKYEEMPCSTEINIKANRSLIISCEGYTLGSDETCKPEPF